MKIKASRLPVVEEPPYLRVKFRLGEGRVLLFSRQLNTREADSTDHVDIGGDDQFATDPARVA